MAEFASICDLPSAADMNPEKVLSGERPLAWEIPIPSQVDTERLQINLTRLRRMQRVGAIGGSIVAEYQGEISETNCVAGINSDGSAIAGKAQIAKKADPCRTNIQDLIDYGTSHTTYGRPLMLHEINRPEAVQKIIDQKRNEAKTDTEAWAHVLDTDLREAIRTGGYNHLMQREDNVLAKTLGIIGNGMYITAIPAEVALSKPPFIALGIFAFFHGFHYCLDRPYFHPNPEDLKRDKRWSFFYGGMQPDRYVALHALSKMPGLISIQK